MDDDLQELPIDIHVGKLVGWLVSRQHSAKDWAENARAVREKINAAIQDMPEHPEILKLLSGSYINYFHCLKIVEILKETEADSKNILGWYTSQRMKDWQTVVKSYEKGGAGLAECGQLLHQYIAFEIPGINSQIINCSQIQDDCDKREQNVHKAALNAHNQYLNNCKQIGIKGNDVREEIFGLLKELPQDMNDIGKSFHNLKDVVQFYLDFISFTCVGKFQDSLLMLRYVIDHGNVTTYEYIHNEAPLTVEDPMSALIEIKNSMSQNESTDEGIDFGGDDGAIDFGGEEDGGVIDFGDGDGIGFGDGEGDDIDWGAADKSMSAGITIEETGIESGVARGTEALSLLLNNSMRNKIVDDLYELEGFLQQRIREMIASDKSSVVLNLWEEAPKSLQMVSVIIMSEQLVNVGSILSSLSTPKMVQLFLISASPRYVDRLAESLITKKKKSELNQDLIDRILLKKEENIKLEKTLHKQLEQLKKSSKVLCPQIQNAVSLKYNNRPVNIMGVMKNL